jgi:hypothetical protein
MSPHALAPLERVGDFAGRHPELSSNAPLLWTISGSESAATATHETSREPDRREQVHRSGLTSR